VTIEPDLKSFEIYEFAKSFATADHSEAGMCIVFILSHGKEGIIGGIDGKGVPDDEILKLFHDDKCPLLASKPKMFVFVHCR
jgi:hypothetical protein